ncbi:MAG: hypothetical protein NTV29_00095 [Planctomycetota bacterium]|nr:hypothetical protein [Planctomycetota bacterium]
MMSQGNSKFVFFMGSCLLGLLVCFGCDSKSGSTSGVSDQEHEHFPAHWPDSIFRASQRIDGILADPVATSVGATSVGATSVGLKTESPTLTSVAELADLVGWLPILAAESDLGREDFSRIDAWSAQWTEPLRKHALGSGALAGNGTLKGFGQVDGLREMAKGLSEICRNEQARIDELQKRYAE